MSRTIPVLLDADLTGYPALPAGNEPDQFFMPQSLRSTESFVLVGTGCFRVIDIALSICNGNPGLVQKILVIDNSKYVKEFWAIIENIFRVSKNLRDAKQSINSDVLRRCVIALGQKTQDDCNVGMRLFVRLLDKILENPGMNFRSLQRMVGCVEMIPQDWTSPAGTVFSAIKEYCSTLSVYAYISNIPSVLPHSNRTELLGRLHDNLSLLAPKATIYSDLVSALPAHFGPAAPPQISLPAHFFSVLNTPELVVLKELSESNSPLFQEKRRKSVNGQNILRWVSKANAISLSDNDALKLEQKVFFLIKAAALYREFMIPTHRSELATFALLRRDIGIALLHLQRTKQVKEEYGTGRVYIESASRFFQKHGLEDLNVARELKDMLSPPPAAARGRR